MCCVRVEKNYFWPAQVRFLLPHDARTVEAGAFDSVPSWMTIIFACDSDAFWGGRRFVSSPFLAGAEVPVVVDALRTHRGLLHPGVPHVEDPHQARQQDVAHRVSERRQKKSGRCVQIWHPDTQPTSSSSSSSSSRSRSSGVSSFGVALSAPWCPGRADRPPRNLRPIQLGASRPFWC